MTREEARREEMFGYFIGHTGPLRILSGIIWGQGKSAAEADCERRVQVRYMESKCPDIRMEDIDLPLSGNVVINAQRRLKEAGRWPAK